MFGMIGISNALEGWPNTFGQEIDTAHIRCYSVKEAPIIVKIDQRRRNSLPSQDTSPKSSRKVIRCSSSHSLQNATRTRVLSLFKEKVLQPIVMLFSCDDTIFTTGIPLTPRQIVPTMMRKSNASMNLLELCGDDNNEL